MKNLFVLFSLLFTVTISSAQERIAKQIANNEDFITMVKRSYTIYDEINTKRIKTDEDISSELHKRCLADKTFMVASKRFNKKFPTIEVKDQEAFLLDLSQELESNGVYSTSDPNPEAVLLTCIKAAHVTANVLNFTPSSSVTAAVALYVLTNKCVKDYNEAASGGN